MTSSRFHLGVRWLALLGYVVAATLFGNGVVQCEGADGHVSIEPFHDACCPISGSTLPADASISFTDECCTDSLVAPDQVVQGRDRLALDTVVLVAMLLPALVEATDSLQTHRFQFTDAPPDTLSVSALSLRSIRLLV